MAYFSNQKSQCGLNSEGSCNGRCWLFCGHLVYITAIWYILLPLVYFMVIWYIFPVLVCCTKKNLATLLNPRWQPENFASSFSFSAMEMEMT
jgi:apolipoprotein N-acyltransferase